jgi:hypothetical protein
VSHSAGAVFRHGVSARDFDEANAFVNGGGIANSLFTGARQLLSSTGAGTPAVIAIEDDQIILSNQVFN